MMHIITYIINYYLLHSIPSETTTGLANKYMLTQRYIEKV